MEDHFREILKKIRYSAKERKLKDLSFKKIERELGVPEAEIRKYVSSEKELIEKLLELERQKFEAIFLSHNFEGVNAIDILLTVSKEVAKDFVLVSPAITVNLKEKYPVIYQEHFDKRIQFVFDKIQINITKGVSQGIYRDDLSIELLARLYISRLIDIHNPDLFPPEKFSFETLFEVMFEDLIRSIGKPEGIAYFEKKRKTVKF